MNQSFYQKPNRRIIGSVLFIITLCLCSGLSHAEDAVVKIHYLGHSAFVLQFDNGINIVSDYGHYNAWVDWGWDSPIHDIGDLIPDVMTYSHTNHEDHYDPDRIPEGVTHILTEFDTLVIGGIHIKPVRTCEESINTESNSSYIFTYKGLKICHLGDAQAQIINIENETVKGHIQHIFPDTFDLLFMTIDGTQQFLEQVEIFIDLLQPKRVIPIHYWTEIYKRDVLRYLDMQNSFGKSYQIKEINGPKYTLSSQEEITPIQIIGLERAPFSLETGVEDRAILIQKFCLNQNYPNPFNPSTVISWQLTVGSDVDLSIYNILGEKVATLISERQEAGYHQVKWDAGDLASGVYYYMIQAGEYQAGRRMVLLR